MLLFYSLILLIYWRETLGGFKIHIIMLAKQNKAHLKLYCCWDLTIGSLWSLLASFMDSLSIYWQRASKGTYILINGQIHTAQAEKVIYVASYLYITWKTLPFGTIRSPLVKVFFGKIKFKCSDIYFINYDIVSADFVWDKLISFGR